MGSTSLPSAPHDPRALMIISLSPDADTVRRHLDLEMGPTERELSEWTYTTTRDPNHTSSLSPTLSAAAPWPNV